MWSKEQIEYSDAFYINVLLDVVEANLDVTLLEEILALMEEEEDYEACDGILRGINRIKNAHKEDLLNELDDKNIDYNKKLRKK